MKFSALLILLFGGVFLFPKDSHNEFLDLFKRAYEKNSETILGDVTTIDFKKDSTGFYLLPKIELDCVQGIDDWKGQSYHVEDLNFDGKKDLIYSDACDPYARTFVFLNKGEKMEEVFNSGGGVISIGAQEKTKTIQIWTGGIGCLDGRYFTTVEFSMDSSFKKSTVVCKGDTEISFSGSYHIKTQSGMVRTSAKINNEVKTHPCWDTPKIIGNQIEEILEQEVTVIDSKNGWELVLFENKDSYLELGWIQL